MCVVITSSPIFSISCLARVFDSNQQVEKSGSRNDVKNYIGTAILSALGLQSGRRCDVLEVVLVPLRDALRRRT